MKMQWTLPGVGVALALALNSAVALAGADGRVQAASGTVVAVTEGSKTIVMQSTLEGEPWIVGAEVGSDTRFEGKAKGLQDVKPGDKITMQWVRQEDGDLARSITTR